MTNKTDRVVLTPAADRDLDDTYRYAAERTSLREADALIDSLIDKAVSLSTFPERGSVPQELEAVGKVKYRQVVVSPFRIIYHRIDETVFVFLIADGRRDIQALLQLRHIST